MKIKIKDNNSLDEGREFKVRRMNYDQVVVNYPGEKGIEILKTDDVEFISENEFDDFLIKHRYVGNGPGQCSTALLSSPQLRFRGLSSFSQRSPYPL